jgi:hypothetical protein
MTVVTTEREGASNLDLAAARRQRRVGSFDPSFQRRIADLTCSAPALEDLADTFPALLLALVTGYATAPRRARALDLIRRGAPLREAADALGLAWWFRKALPPDPDFGFRIAALVPGDPRFIPAWLARVAQAHDACGAEYALWLARQDDAAASPPEALMFMAAWAWFGQHEGNLGHRLVRKAWHTDMSFRKAREELGIWRQRLRLIESLGLGIETPWLTDGAAGGYGFVALRTAEDFVAESEALDNCLDQYADQLRTGATALFSIRRNGRSVACVEIGLHETEVTMPTIVQLRAARNRRAPPEVWQATFAWLGSQRLEPLTPERQVPKSAKRIEARRQLWEPYLRFLARSPHARVFRHLVMGTRRGPAAGSPARVPRRRAAELPLRSQAASARTGTPRLDAGIARLSRS